MKIPKIIMQTWKTDDLPEDWAQGRVETMKTLHDWEHILMTDEDNLHFVKEYFPQYLEMYESYKYPIQRADAIRYMWLYIHGGVYCDLDIVITKDITPLLENCNIAIAEEIPIAKMFNKFSNMFMASVPKHRFWLQCLERMYQVKDTWHPSKMMYIMKTTGPGVVSYVYKKFKYTEEDLCMLPNKYLHPCKKSRLETCDYSHAYVRNIEGGSWLSTFDKVVWVFMDNIAYTAVAIICLSILWWSWYR